ncbi:hypothetical protein P3T18_001535 [Paraburkholderia sp. GAS199]|uniref:hypothetical protein n=1 Tax=Paraburkholderia sp. GAS199 TaxID=3035126 RepID=UPI003D1E5C42
MQRPPGSQLKVPLSHTPAVVKTPVVKTQLPAKVWGSSSRALTDPSYLAPEPELETLPRTQKLRHPVALGASVVVVVSAVYLGFIHSDDSAVGTPIAVSGKVQTQNPKQPLVVAQRPAPARPVAPPRVVASVKPPPVRSVPTPAPAPVAVAAAPPARRVAALASAAPLSAQAQRNTPNPPPSQLDKARADSARQLRAARANLQQNNLSATKARLAAAIAAQPDNRDALNLRASLTQREQQRDALLSLARGCGYIARWNCVSQNAGSALQIDSSSKEAQRLVTLATRESELASAWTQEPETPAITPDDHPSMSHH